MPPVANVPAGDSEPSSPRLKRWTELPAGSLVCVYSTPSPGEAMALDENSSSSPAKRASRIGTARERGRGTGMWTSKGRTGDGRLLVVAKPRALRVTIGAFVRLESMPPGPNPARAGRFGVL